ncbi:hypothetical protein HN51_060017 [Arachis hypogaea]
MHRPRLCRHPPFPASPDFIDLAGRPQSSSSVITSDCSVTLSTTLLFCSSRCCHNLPLYFTTPCNSTRSPLPLPCF